MFLLASPPPPPSTQLENLSAATMIVKIIILLKAQSKASRLQSPLNYKGEASPGIYADWVNGGWF